MNNSRQFAIVLILAIITVLILSACKSDRHYLQVGDRLKPEFGDEDLYYTVKAVDGDWIRLVPSKPIQFGRGER